MTSTLRRYDKPQPLRDVDHLNAGEVVVWTSNGELSTNPHDLFMVLRSCPAGWMGVRLHRMEWEDENTEWLIDSSQIEGGRYTIVGRVEP